MQWTELSDNSDRKSSLGGSGEPPRETVSWEALTEFFGKLWGAGEPVDSSTVVGRALWEALEIYTSVCRYRITSTYSDTTAVVRAQRLLIQSASHNRRAAVRAAQAQFARDCSHLPAYWPKVARTKMSQRGAKMRQRGAKMEPR